ncbi:transcriptional protein SWT1-like [Ptychodera flava]|uniref:transcriptional protein SWT1-like n=1 Tax=Ptychodera flava TaxID=63121 RepID=UPI00396A3457
MSHMSKNSSSKVDLPDGWIACTSTKKIPDKVYYFNMNTGNSSWNVPKKDDNERLMSMSMCGQPSSSGRSTSDAKPVSPTVKATPLNELLFGGDPPAKSTVNRIQSWLKGLDHNVTVNKTSEDDQPHGSRGKHEQPHGREKHVYKSGTSTSVKLTPHAKKRKSSHFGDKNFLTSLSSKAEPGDSANHVDSPTILQDETVKVHVVTPNICHKHRHSTENNNEKSVRNSSSKMKKVSFGMSADVMPSTSTSHQCNKRQNVEDEPHHRKSQKKTQKWRTQKKTHTHKPYGDVVERPRKLLRRKMLIDCNVKKDGTDQMKPRLAEDASKTGSISTKTGVTGKSSEKSELDPSSDANTRRTSNTREYFGEKCDVNANRVERRNDPNIDVKSKYRKHMKTTSTVESIGRRRDLSSKNITSHGSKVMVPSVSKSVECRKEDDVKSMAKETEKIVVVFPSKAKTTPRQHDSQIEQITVEDEINEDHTRERKTFTAGKTDWILSMNGNLDKTSGDNQDETTGEQYHKGDSDVECMEITSEHSSYSISSHSDFNDCVEIVDMDIDEVDPGNVLTEVQEIRETVKLDPIEEYEGLSSLPESSACDKAGTSSFVLEEEKLYVVLDTNVLISHLTFLEDFRDHFFKGYGRPSLVIPWVVMQELDILKRETSIKDAKTAIISKKAQRAVIFIHENLQSGHPRVKGQSMVEASVKLQSITLESNDDRVLQCCLQYQEKVNGATVVLFSDDKNLCSKAIVSNVPAFTKKTLVDGLEDLLEINPQQPPPPPPPPRPTPPSRTTLPLTSLRVMPKPMTTLPRPRATPTPPRPPHSIQATQGKTVCRPASQSESTTLKQRDQEKVIKAKADEHLCKLRTVLRDALSVALVMEMKTIYGELWQDIIFVKPPWTLNDILQCYNKHWMAVFGMILKRDVKVPLENLSSYFEGRTGYGLDMKQALHLMSDALELLNALRKHDSYNGQLDNAVRKTQELRESSKHILDEVLKETAELRHANKPSATESKARGRRTCNVEESVSHVLEVFDVIWKAINYYTAQVFSVVGYVDALFPPLNYREKPTRFQAIQLLSTLCTQVECLATALMNMLKMPVTERMEALSQAINTFTQNVPIDDFNIKMTWQSLNNCRQSNECWKSLSNGHSQLVFVLQRLKQCVSHLST